ncbi:unnamed protein product [Caenorhabditis auriculariae]|uniref:Acyltransferase 3 domain-containing protein n=1 Tax=Caenorhabditis auriculariae TaxID=2777116 RepID=A0A8S1H7D9_9PELO|nr:unnamed protein product [Caenorhabditis auriculariae]
MEDILIDDVTTVSKDVELQFYPLPVEVVRKKKKRKKTKKRPDIESLRGIGVFAVILGNFRPQIFPNGFAGVELFYVISGYLASVSSNNSKEKLQIFYYSRLKRVLPLYFLSILLILIVMGFLTPNKDFGRNISGGTRAILFVSNFENDAESSLNLFSHLLPISTGFQTLIIFPFVLIIVNLFPNKLHVYCHIFIGIASLVFNFFIRDFSVFSQFWKFSAGVFAHHLQSDLGELEQNVFFYPFLLLFLPFLHLKHICLEISAVAFAALLIQINAGANFTLCKFFEFIGDISYSWYLFHWPIVVYVNIYHGNTFYAPLIGIFISFMIANIISKNFER